MGFSFRSRSTTHKKTGLAFAGKSRFYRMLDVLSSEVVESDHVVFHTE